MDGATAAASLGIVVQIIFLDLLLSGDNALVIALACRRLPPEQARRAAWAGAAGAISLRVFLTLMTSELMTLPFVQLVGAIPLLAIALNLMSGDDEADALGESARSEANLLAAVGIIIVSDAAMSFDNVVALAAVSAGNVWLLLFGLALSVPLIVFGSFGFSTLMRAFPWLADLGAGLLGWVAGGMIAHDPIFAGWIDAQAPALALALPLACALFVLVRGRIGRERAAGAVNPRPRRIEAPPKAVKPPKPQKSHEAKMIETPVAVAREDVQTPEGDAEAENPEIAPAFGIGRAETPDDRLVAMGLVALFVIFGVFLLIFILLPDT
ncbi:TerC family protein [Rhodoblastus sp.]|uniref:TerC family protein n=1 Tax=Rhodoblastus sp. TaxID=1962975 RepID=UPI003F94A0DD